MESEALSGTAAPTAVVWTPPGTEVPQELRAALGKGGLNVTQARGVYTALAALCQLDRAGGAGAETRAQCALVLVNPSSLDSPAALCGAAEMYAGRARLWMYTTGATRLRAVTPEDITQWKGAAAPPAAPAPARARPAKPQPYKPQNPQPQPAVTIKRPVPPVAVSRTGPGASRTAQAVDAAPRLRLAGDPAELKMQGDAAAADGTAADGAGKEARQRPVLTPEELEMLLRDDDRD
jgi:hypothetical protein